MSKCPMHKVRADLPPLTERLKKLGVDERGYPVPFFVAYVDGKPEFRAFDPKKLLACINLKLCWVCGGSLGKFVTFAVGPMCMINRNSSEPPSHLDCCLWSVKGCPFLSKPKMVRREDEFTETIKGNIAGISTDRNPGVAVLWTTRDYKIHREGRDRILFEPGEPESLSFWREGRQATRAEILESIETGLPKLREFCFTPDDHKALDVELKRGLKLVPSE